MRWLGAILLLAIFAQAGITDFLTLHQAKEAYADKQYDKAAEAYGKIAQKGNNEALFDQADALYKMGRYEDALKKFQAVKSPKLTFDKLYNSGNCYARLGKIDEAIKAYEEALKIKEDKDARYNLELLKKLKKQQQKKQKPQSKEQQEKKEEDKQQQENGKQKQGESGSKQSKQGKNGKDEQSKKKDKKRESEKKSTQGDKKSEKKEMTKAQKEKEAAMRAKAQKKVPISDMEVRKWNRVLNQRGTPTLMLPLPSEKNGKRSPDETKPW